MIQELLTFLKTHIEEDGVLAKIDKYISSNSSSAGSKSREEVFTREFLCPTMAKFFYVYQREKLGLKNEEIESGLGTEGYKHIDGYGFTPARSKKHFFTKGQVIESDPPQAWFKDSDKSLTSFMACPDFAIRSPLPMNVVGEVKYFHKGSKNSAIKELYNDLRQTMFYLGAFNEYTDALLVVADASEGHIFNEALSLLREDLLERFGDETNIHLCVLKLR